MKYFAIVAVIIIFLLLLVGDNTPVPEVAEEQSEEAVIVNPDTFDDDAVYEDDHLSGATTTETFAVNTSDHTVPSVLVDTPQTISQDITTSISAELHQVLRVIDGDTIEILYDGVKRTVRYIGVDTPETVHPSKPVECMGREASEYNNSLVAGKMVRLERDVSDTDRYGRLLRYVYIGDLMVNEVLLAEGYANVMTYPPDVKYTERFLELEQDARAGKRGLWSDICLEYTASNTKPVPTVMQSSPDDTTCNIKGNINASKEKIFHVPGCQSYEKTVINQDADERWFCSEQEALNAGWRKALNCS